MNRAPDISNAGMVSMAMWIVRYVEPQMTYTAAKAITIWAREAWGVDTREVICYNTKR